MTIKVIVFDLYGTLVFIKEKTNPYKMLLEAAPVEKRKELRNTVLSKNFFTTPKQEVESFGLNAFIDQAKFTRDLEVELKSTTLFPESIWSLERLKGLGYLTGLISNLATPYKKTFFSLGLDKLIDHCVFSCDVGYIKPDRRIYEIMSRKTGAAFSEMLMVGDSLDCDVVGPKAIGMRAILLDRSDSSQETKKIKSLDEILKII